MPIITQPTEIFQAPPGTPPAPPQPGGVPPVAPPTPPPGPTVAGGVPPSPPGGTPPGSVPPDIAAMLPPAGGNKKKFLIIGIGIILLIVVIFFIVRIVSSFSSQPDEEENAELTYWGVYQDPKVMQVLIDDFERENPNIKVKYSQQSPQQYRDRLVTRIRSGTGPDIYQYHNSWVPMISGVLLPLSSEAVDPKDFEKSYYKVIISDLVRNGGILGIPLGIDTLAMYTNDQMFASQGLTPPKDWDQFVQVAAALTTRTDPDSREGQITTAGAALGTYDNVSHAADIISMFLVQTRVDPKAIGKSSNEAIMALEYYTLFAKGEGDVQKVWDGSLDPSVIAFANGRAGMFFGYSWDIFTLQAINPGLAFSIHPVPQLDEENMKTIASYWVEGVSSETKYPKSAMKFMKYLHQKETQQKYFAENAKVRKLGSPYARVDLAESLKDDPRLYPFVLQAPYAVSTPFVADTQDTGLNSTLNGYLKNAILGISDNTSGETAIETLDNGVKQAFRQYAQ